jgi:osmotically-inducible protein OsmY
MARSDELIKKNIVDQMTRDDRVDASGISTEVSNGIVTLSGEVPTYYAKSAAHEVAVDTMGVLDEVDKLVMGKLGGLNQ